jgi:riboflavin kinase/FMN adenylyltransferase
MSLLILEKLEPSLLGNDKEGCVCIGMFDGIHKGHQQLILKTVHCAKENRQPSVLLTLQNNPKHGRNDTLTLTSNVEKIEMIRALGIDILLNLPFPGEIACLSPLEFIDSVLVNSLHASNVFVGKNFRFGHKRFGTSDDLKYIGSERNMHVMVEHMINFEGKEISSTFCRFLIHTRMFEKAKSMLGYPYFITGSVIHGHGRGGKIGLPTINLNEAYPEKIKPGDGVFITKTLIHGKLYDSITLYGPVPSFNQTEKSIETLILDFDEVIYGEKVTVLFYSYLRDIKQFENPLQLKNQIDQDQQSAREYFKNPEKFPLILNFLKSY